MTAQDLVREGNLEAALGELQQLIRREPSEVRHRIFLFQLLCVLGRWDRAANQLELCAEMGGEELRPFVQTYATLVNAERVREAVFAGRVTPLVIGEPAEWTAALIEALRLVSLQKYEEAEDLRTRAFDQAPSVGGQIDAQAFAWIGDADTRLGPMLEAVINGRYCWIPFTRLRSVRIEAPTDLRDLVWTPVSLTYSTSAETVGFVPARYALPAVGSDLAITDAQRLGRRTEWVERPGGAYFGLGQRMLVTDQAEHPLLHVRTIQLAETT